MCSSSWAGEHKLSCTLTARNGNSDDSSPPMGVLSQ